MSHRRADVGVGVAAEQPTVNPLPRWTPAYIALGSNLSEPVERIREAFDEINGVPATQLKLRSRLYRTRPLGPQDQPQFVNAAAGVLTQLTPRGLLDELLKLEQLMGRNRQERWGPRIIDLDLICMTGAAVAEPGLTLPHPGVSARNFVLYPLSDIAPTLDIAGYGRVSDLKLRAGGEGIDLLE